MKRWFVLLVLLAGCTVPEQKETDMACEIAIHEFMEKKPFFEVLSARWLSKAWSSADPNGIPGTEPAWQCVNMCQECDGSSRKCIKPAWYLSGDLNGDLKVNLEDFAVFSAHYNAVECVETETIFERDVK
ncbi:MAG: hypothetical protein JXA82_18190 [Sedimentisphaerales bacterium]|nr:hypothetical protein [Sedimentisphaerales bacterium]